MSSTARAFAILGLFSRTHSSWHTDDIITSLRYSRASGYRYVKELVDAGFLQKVAAGRYALGPRIVELDHQLRQSDPVLLAAVPIMEALAHRTGLNVVLSALFGGDRVIDIHHTRVGNGLDLGYGRGHLRPLLQGAAPKVLVAGLPRAALQRLYHRRVDAVVAAKLGGSWDEFRRHMGEPRGTLLYVAGRGGAARRGGGGAHPQSRWRGAGRAGAGRAGGRHSRGGRRQTPALADEGGGEGAVGPVGRYMMGSEDHRRPPTWTCRHDQGMCVAADPLATGGAGDADRAQPDARRCTAGGALRNPADIHPVDLAGQVLVRVPGRCWPSRVGPAVPSRV